MKYLPLDLDSETHLRLPQDLFLLALSIVVWDLWNLENRTFLFVCQEFISTSKYQFKIVVIVGNFFFHSIFVGINRTMLCFVPSPFVEMLLISWTISAYNPRNLQNMNGTILIFG